MRTPRDAPAPQKPRRFWAFMLRKYTWLCTRLKPRETVALTPVMRCAKVPVVEAGGTAIGRHGEMSDPALVSLTFSAVSTLDPYAHCSVPGTMADSSSAEKVASTCVGWLWKS
jgi:hypothetical protein